jgi:hypothetical protein
MRFMFKASQPSRAIRAALATLVLVFALGSIAHAAHSHGNDFAGTPSQHATCGFCVSFGAMAAPTQSAPVDIRFALPTHALPARECGITSVSFAGSAQPRAPPQL